MKIEKPVEHITLKSNISLIPLTSNVIQNDRGRLDNNQTTSSTMIFQASQIPFEIP